MKRILATVLKKNNKKLFFILFSILLVVAVIAIFSWITPKTTTLQLDDSIPSIGTTYIYKAVVKPNVLYPEGGTIDVGDTLYKKITTAIPFDLKTIINSEEEVLVKGTYDIQLLIKAGDIWERAFPLQNKQNFERKGRVSSIIDKSYKINLDQVTAFILQVENETGVKHSQYEIEVVPTINGVIHYSNQVREINIQDRLKFSYLFNEIKLASEKSFNTPIQPTESRTTLTQVSLLGLSIPLIAIRVTSTSLFFLLLMSILFSVAYLDPGSVKVVKSEAERLKKKYGNQAIRISQQIDFTGKTAVRFATFKSLLKIASDIEQPIFFYEDNNSKMYLIVDGDCVYTYVPSIVEAPAISTKNTGNENAYVVN